MADWSSEEREAVFPLLAELITIDLEDKRLEVGTELPAEIWAGHVTFKTERGWTITVFNDCGGWDYIDDAISPDGESLCERLGIDYLGGLTDFYQPTTQELNHIWRWNDTETV